MAHLSICKQASEDKQQHGCVLSVYQFLFLSCKDVITPTMSVECVFNSQPFDHSHKVAKFCYADKVIF